MSAPEREKRGLALSVVIPVFNEQETLAYTCQRLTDVSLQLVERQPIERVELLFVDDGSSDRSAELLQAEAVALAPGAVTMEVLRLARNFGHSAAVFAGLERAAGDVVALIDADLQDPPELFERMLEAMLTERADVVYGQRLRRAGEGVFKRATAWAYYRLINLLSPIRIPNDTGDFRLITREVRDAVVALREPEPFLRGLVAWVGYKQVALPYERDERRFGQTKYTLRKMFRLALQTLLSFSSFPLKLTIYLGLAGIAFSCALALHAVTVWWQGEALPGWSSTIIALAFGESITLLLLGVLGLYVGRIHTASQGRPRYIVRRGLPPWELLDQAPQEDREAPLTVEREARV